MSVYHDAIIANDPYGDEHANYLIKKGLGVGSKREWTWNFVAVERLTKKQAKRVYKRLKKI